MATQASDSIKQKSRLTTADELTVIVQRAQAFTNASGAAIAIGNSEEIVCRARSGSSAPDVGTSLRVEGSFTGICIQTGRELRCDDAETDTRVDTTAIRALGIRSMVVTPIKDEGKVVGVLAVFAPTPHAFTITHVAVLKTMADQISALLQKERRSKDEPQVEVPVARPKPAIGPTPLPPVVIRPSGTSSAAAAAPARTNGSGPITIEPVRPVAVAADIAMPVPFPKKKEEKREPKRAEYKPEHKSEHSASSKSNFGVLDAVAGEPEKAGVNKFVVLGAAVVVLAAAAVTWVFLKSHKSNSSAQAQAVEQTQQNPAAAPATTAANVNASAPAASTTSTPAPAVTPANTKTSVPEKTDGRKSEPASKNEKQNKPTPAAPAPTTVALTTGGSKIAGNASRDESPDVAPQIAVGGGTSSEIASLARPAGGSVPAMVAQSDLVNAKAIRAVPAVYPDIAKTRRLSGTVIVQVTVGKDGKVSNMKFVSGPMIFRDSAFEAVKQWLFKPATLNGQPIEQETEIKVIFTPR